MSKGFEAFADSAVLDLGELEGTTHTFSNQPDSALDNDDDFDRNADTDQLLGSGDKPAGLKSYSFWSVEFYQQFFDVDTDDVIKRLLWSVTPRPGGSTENFFKNKIRGKPDLYGPFWICVTLIFSVAISGNVASYLQSDTSFKWHYDFHKVSIVSSAVFGYAWITPAVLFFAIWWTGSKATTTDPEAGSSTGLTFLELVCLYGYSLAVFIPLSVLWLIQLSAVQWTLVLVGFGLSGGVLALSLWPDLSKKSAKFGTILVVVVVGLHLLLACSFMLAFFHAPAKAPVQVIDPTAKNTTLATGVADAPGKDSGKSDKSKEKREDEKEIETKVDQKEAEGRVETAGAGGGADADADEKVSTKKVDAPKVESKTETEAKSK